MNTAVLFKHLKQKRKKKDPSLQSRHELSVETISHVTNIKL